MYKIIRRREAHTGGGDGDDPSETESNLEEDDDDDLHIEDDEAPKQPKTDKPKKTRRERFSQKQLGLFKDSIYYEMIDAV